MTVNFMCLPDWAKGGAQAAEKRDFWVCHAVHSGGNSAPELGNGAESTSPAPCNMVGTPTKRKGEGGRLALRVTRDVHLPLPPDLGHWQTWFWDLPTQTEPCRPSWAPRR